MILIRRFRKADAEGVAKLMQALAHHHGDRARAKPKDFLLHCLGVKRLGDCWVAQHDGMLCGFVLTYDRFNFVRAQITRTIDLLFVLQSCRKMGIGRALMATAAQDALRHGVKRIVIGATADNLPTLKFYQKLGLQKEYKKTMRFTLDTAQIRELARKSR